MLIAYIITSFIIIVLISYSISYKLEKKLLLKLSIFYFISSLTISINSLIPLPLGFFPAFLIASKSYMNQKSKKFCCIMCLVNTYICVMLYGILK